MSAPQKRWRVVGPLLALAMVIAVAAHAGAGVQVAVSPETLTVAPGDTFDVTLRVPVGGDPFNTYDAVVSFDPAVLQFVLQSQTIQEGSLLHDSCSTHSTFYLCNPAADSIAITDGMLGNGCMVRGPGTLITLRFVSLGPTGVTYLRLRKAIFYEDGLYVTPVQSRDALVAVGVTLGVPHAPVPAADPAVRVLPNPSRGTCWIRPGAAARGASAIAIVDPAGRLVRTLLLAGGDGRDVPWDGRDASGRPAAPGVYACILQGVARRAPVLLIRIP